MSIWRAVFFTRRFQRTHWETWVCVDLGICGGNGINLLKILGNDYNFLILKPPAKWFSCGRSLVSTEIDDCQLVLNSAFPDLCFWSLHTLTNPV